MLSIFKKFQPDEKVLAAAAYEKVVSLTQDTRDARSVRIRMALLCRSHLDKSFIAGAELTAAYLEQVALSVARGTARPEPPEASCFRYIKTSRGEKVCVYLPAEFANEAFSLGALYQRMQLDAEKAIDAMQALADRLFIEHLKLTDTLPVLQFLREEIGLGLHDQAADGQGPAASASED